MPQYKAFYELLSSANLWVLAIGLYFVAVPVIRIGRFAFEGVGYNVALSSEFGDIFLTLAAVLGVYILQRGALLPAWLVEPWQQWTALLAIVVSAILACLLTLKSRSGQMMDIYHDIIVVSMFLFLTILLMPVYFNSGTWREILAGALCVGVWAGLVVFDLKTERMNQRQWMAVHGTSIFDK